MQVVWPCVTCPNRASGFCGALLGRPADEEHLLERPDWQHYRGARAGEQVIIRNQPSEKIFVLCNGWAFRAFQLSNGRRQILNFLLPGDLFSAAALFEDRSSFSAEALTEVRFSVFQREAVQARFVNSSFFSSTVGASCATAGSYADELLTALGQRSAEERIAYLFLHLMRRISLRDVIRDQRYRLPLRQQHIADAVGLTPVHVSRVIGLFRERGLIEFSSGVLHVLDRSELERIGSLN